MRLTFLGTGAADWNEPLESGEYRRFTSTLIDGKLLIDGTETVADSLPLFGSVDAMLFTHSHRDHFSFDFLKQVAPKQAFCERSWAAEFGMNPLTPCVGFECAGYAITPVPSNHSTERKDEVTLNYVISDGHVRILYATDGAWLTNTAYHVIKAGAALDAVVFDGTVGEDLPDDWRVFEHNTLPMVRIMRDSMKKSKLLKSDAPVFVTHLARTLHPSQAELEAREALSASPLVICRDGMSVQI